MSKKIHYIYYICIIIAIVGCGKNNESSFTLSTDADTLYYNSIGGTQSCKISSNTSWRYSITQTGQWCSVDASGASGNGILRIFISANTTTSLRDAIINITYGKSSKKTLIIRQEAPAKANYTDGEIRIYEINRETNPVNVVFIGDGFTSADFIDGGNFDKAVKEGVDALFNVEPYKSYRKYFNIYKIAAISAESGASHADRKITRNTAFKTIYNGGSSMTTDDNKVYSYVSEIPNIKLTQTPVILIVNDTRYGGTTFMYSNGKSVSICPMNRSTSLPGGFGPVLIHEAGGHGFGRLADEYVNDDSGTISQEDITELKTWFNYGYYDNIDVTSDRSKVKWAEFFNLSGYEAVGIYEGGYYHDKGIWRPESVSCMDYNISYFNAPSRQSIVKRIMSITNETYSLNKFVENDKIKIAPKVLFTKSMNVSLPHLGQPVLIKCDQ